jgi:hypothetical protein
MFRQAIHFASGAMPMPFFSPARSGPEPTIVPTVCVPWPPPSRVSSSHGCVPDAGHTLPGFWT